MKITSTEITEEKVATIPQTLEELTTIDEINESNILKTKNIFEFDQISCEEEKDLYFLTNIKAPTFQQDESHQRSSIDLLCVIDKSGSMSGTKIEVKKKF